MEAKTWIDRIGKMKKDVFVIANQVVSALGVSLEENMHCIESKQTGIKLSEDQSLSNEALYCGLIDKSRMESIFSNIFTEIEYTYFEKLMIYSTIQALKDTIIDAASDDTLFVISTTKGNIDLLDNNLASRYPADRIHLWSAAEAISNYFGNSNRPLVVSNACVSGVVAINLAATYISNGKFKNIIVLGGDILSKFVVSGFQSFQSLSAGVCKPFDANRDGLSLGEAAGCMILSSQAYGSKIKVLGGSTHNDANHISGPSRTAEGFYYAAMAAIKASNINTTDIDYLSAHGTATPYNDEMEAIGISRLGLQKNPVHSLKAYWGHTLGAAGIIESIALIESMKKGVLLPTLGYAEHGVSEPVNVSRDLEKYSTQYALKLASGFSGVNSSVVFQNMEGGK